MAPCDIVIVLQSHFLCLSSVQAWRWWRERWHVLWLQWQLVLSWRTTSLGSCIRQIRPVGHIVHLGMENLCSIEFLRWFAFSLRCTLPLSKGKPQNYRPLTPVEYWLAWFVLLTIMNWRKRVSGELAFVTETTDWHLVFVSCFTLSSFGVLNWYLNFIIYKRCYIFRHYFFS